MKKITISTILIACIIVAASFENRSKDASEPFYIEPSVQRSGDAAKGYEYLIYGDFLKSGFPYDNFIFLRGKDKDNYLNRTGKPANVAQGYNVVKNADGMEIVIPTCLQCHSEVFEGKLYVGLGNTFVDFTKLGQMDKRLSSGLKLMHATAARSYRAFQPMAQSMLMADAQMETEVQGVNSADRLAELLVAHRDPQTLKWSDSALLDIPQQVIPSDVPAWWLLKKKNAMFYNGFGRGDFARFLMASNLLTVSDSAEASEVDSHFGDVLAYIKSIQPPKYPKEIDHALAAKGKAIFADNCQRCHGTYGDNGSYPNLLVPEAMIQTDSLLFTANQQNPQFIEWFNNSWFARGATPARLEPHNGYIAPPLDGVWITAPYFHNGSVPTLEGVLNSKVRPKYWQRDFDHPEYDYVHIGWKYEAKDGPYAKKVYNTTLPGYGNYGHYFGDALTDDERKAVIEYLKTL